MPKHLVKAAAVLLALWVGPAFAGSMTLLGVGKTSAAAPAFVGTGDVVGSANAWWSVGIGYNAAYAASGTNPAADVCDSGGTNCITLNVGTNGLVAAPGATACGGNPCVSISKLYDQSGANFCSGPCDLTQSANASRPALLTNCGTGTMLCAQFTSSGFHLDGPTLPSISQPFTVSGAVKETTNNSAGGVEILTTPCHSGYLESNDGSSHNTFAIFSATTFNNTTTILSTPANYALTGVYNSTSSISSVNGTQTTGNAGNLAWTGGATSLGFGGCLSGTPWSGNALEIGIWPTGFTPTQITNVTSRQRTNWGF